MSAAGRVVARVERARGFVDVLPARALRPIRAVEGVGPLPDLEDEATGVVRFDPKPEPEPTVIAARGEHGS